MRPPLLPLWGLSGSAVARAFALIILVYTTGIALIFSDSSLLHARTIAALIFALQAGMLTAHVTYYALQVRSAATQLRLPGLRRRLGLTDATALILAVLPSIAWWAISGHAPEFLAWIAASAAAGAIMTRVAVLWAHTLSQRARAGAVSHDSSSGRPWSVGSIVRGIVGGPYSATSPLGHPAFLLSVAIAAVVPALIVWTLGPDHSAGAWLRNWQDSGVRTAALALPLFLSWAACGYYALRIAVGRHSLAEMALLPLRWPTPLSPWRLIGPLMLTPVCLTALLCLILDGFSSHRAIAGLIGVATLLPLLLVIFLVQAIDQPQRAWRNLRFGYLTQIIVLASTLGGSHLPAKLWLSVYALMSLTYLCVAVFVWSKVVRRPSLWAER